MRRAFAIVLIVFFGLGPLAAALQAGDDARLPACCRRNGAHHCAMSAALRAWMLRAGSQAPAFTAPDHCPLYPALGQAFAPAHALPSAAIVWSASGPRLSIVVSSHAAPRSVFSGARTVRGPPASTLA